MLFAGGGEEVRAALVNIQFQRLGAFPERLISLCAESIGKNRHQIGKTQVDSLHKLTDVVMQSRKSKSPVADTVSKQFEGVGRERGSQRLYSRQSLTHLFMFSFSILILNYHHFVAEEITYYLFIISIFYLETTAKKVRIYLEISFCQIWFIRSICTSPIFIDSSVI